MSSKIYISVCPVCEGTEFEQMFDCVDNLVSKESFTICKCKKCGFGFTQDFPSESEIGHYYESAEYVSHSDTKKGVINMLYHQARKIALRSKTNIVKEFAAVEHSMLADIGCGTGYFLNEMKENKWVVTGIEQSAAVRKQVKTKFNLDVQDADYINHLSPKSKDVITMWHVLEHLENPGKVLDILHAAMKDDGVGIIALPNKESYDAHHYKSDWAAYDVPRHLWHFSADDFELLANKHKFDLVDIKPMYFDALYISMLSEKNRKTFLETLLGLIRGGVYSLRSRQSLKHCSSLIYIIKKKK